MLIDAIVGVGDDERVAIAELETKILEGKHVRNLGDDAVGGFVVRDRGYAGDVTVFVLLVGNFVPEGFDIDVKSAVVGVEFAGDGGDVLII